MKIHNCAAIKNKFSVLSMILKRTRLQIYRRLHSLKMEPLRKGEFLIIFMFTM